MVPFTVKAGNQDALIKVESLSNDSQYTTFYVHANDIATVNVADGKYVVKYALGDTWYGKDCLFGANTAYSKADEVLEFETSYSGNYVYYSQITITLYTVWDGNLSTVTISGDNFR